MANPDYVPGAFFKHHEPPCAVSRHRKRKAKADALEAAYKAVDARDKGICQVTGRHTTPGAADPRVRREHHHLKGRNVRPEWREKPERIVTVSAQAHQLITQGWIEVEGDDMRRAVFFHWAHWVHPKDRIFEIAPKGRGYARTGGL